VSEHAIASRGRFSVARSGGNTPRRLHEILATEPYRHQIQWDAVHVFWGDERRILCILPEARGSKETQAL
jgi:6-phosphogluconolactonase